MELTNGKPEELKEAFGFYTKVSGQNVHFTIEHSGHEASQRIGVLTLKEGSEASLLLQGIHGKRTCEALGIEPGGIPNVIFSPTGCKPFDLRDVESLVHAARLMVEADVAEGFEDVQTELSDMLRPFADVVGPDDRPDAEEIEAASHQALDAEPITMKIDGSKLAEDVKAAFEPIREALMEAGGLLDRVAKLERDSHPPVDIASAVRAELKVRGFRHTPQEKC